MIQDIESPFNLEEVFFSRTDTRGIIQSGNEVFRRVSEYSWDELLQKPHNLIRHPDMPKGVFHVLWDYLKAQKPIAAYVKNKSKTGKYYWVLALAMPIENGFLSVRVKPSSALLQVIEKEYLNLRKAEQERSLASAQSQVLLMGRIQALGFQDYSAFMTHALFEELENRQKTLAKSVPLLSLLAEFRAPSESLINGAKQLMNTFREGKFLPLNLEIGASHIGTEGLSIAVVASQYQNSVDEIKQELASFIKGTDLVLAKIQDAQFLACSSLLMLEVLGSFKNQSVSETEKINIALEMECLTQLSKKYSLLANQSLASSTQTLSQFTSSCDRMKQLLLSLEIVRLTGKMEASRLPSEGNTLNGLIDQLKSFQGLLLKTVGTLNQSSAKLSETIAQCMAK